MSLSEKLDLVSGMISVLDSQNVEFNTAFSCGKDLLSFVFECVKILKIKCLRIHQEVYTLVYKFSSLGDTTKYTLPVVTPN